VALDDRLEAGGSERIEALVEGTGRVVGHVASLVAAAGGRADATGRWRAVISAPAG
jgi:hypothetical protein